MPLLNPCPVISLSLPFPRTETQSEYVRLCSIEPHSPSLSSKPAHVSTVSDCDTQVKTHILVDKARANETRPNAHKPNFKDVQDGKIEMVLMTNIAQRIVKISISCFMGALKIESHCNAMAGE